MFEYSADSLYDSPSGGKKNNKIQIVEEILAQQKDVQETEVFEVDDSPAEEAHFQVSEERSFKKF